MCSSSSVVPRAWQFVGESGKDDIAATSSLDPCRQIPSIAYKGPDSQTFAVEAGYSISNRDRTRMRRIGRIYAEKRQAPSASIRPIRLICAPLRSRMRIAGFPPGDSHSTPVHPSAVNPQEFGRRTRLGYTAAQALMRLPILRARAADRRRALAFAGLNRNYLAPRGSGNGAE